MAAAIVTHTKVLDGRGLKILTFTWTSSDTGVAAFTTEETYRGRVVGLVTVPNGAAAPTDNWDLTISDKRGIDVLAGAGANRHTTNTQHVVAEESLGYVVDSTLSLAIANAGDTKQGVVHLFLDLC